MTKDTHIQSSLHRRSRDNSLLLCLSALLFLGSHSLACGKSIPVKSQASEPSIPPVAEAQAKAQTPAGPAASNNVAANKAGPETPDQAKAASAEDLSNAPPVRRDGTVLGESTLMGTRVSINLFLGTSPADKTSRRALAAGQAIQAAFNEIARIESIASEWDPQSEISRLNQQAGQAAFVVTPELGELLERSIAISRATQGRFDITFYSVGRLWSFKDGAKPPQAREVKAALQRVDYRLIDYHQETRQARLKKAKVAIGMGAIAKGYGVDKAAELLKTKGFENFIVEAGGDTYVAGQKGDAPWQVGVQNPAGPGAIGSIAARNEAIVTSGNYERFFIYRGEHYTHIIDPKTGYPIKRSKSPRSVTIIANNATDADAYCTAVAVMGTKAGMAFVESQAGLEAVIVDAKGKVHLSRGAASRFESWDPKSAREAK